MKEAMIDTNHVASTIQLLPARVEEAEKPQQPCDQEKHINPYAEGTLPVEASVDPHAVETSKLVFFTGVDTTAMKTQQPSVEETSAPLNRLVPSLEEESIINQIFESTTCVSPVVVTEALQLQQTNIKMADITAGTQAFSNGELVDKKQIVEPKSPILSISVQNEVSLQLFKEEIHSISGSQEFSLLKETVNKHQIESTTFVAPISVKNEIESLQLFKEEIPVILNSQEASSLEETVNKNQMESTGCVALASVNECQQPLKEEMDNSHETLSFEGTVNKNQIESTGCVALVSLKNEVEPQQTNVNATLVILDPPQGTSSREEKISEAQTFMNATLISPTLVDFQEDEKVVLSIDTQTADNDLEMTPEESENKEACSAEVAANLPFVCSDCGKRFRTEAIRSIHQRVHTYDAKKPFPCTLCKKTFGSTSYLLRHYDWHRGEKPYVCSICEKTFITSCACRAHMNVHTGEKPYKCKYCGRAFKSMSQRSSHAKTHNTGIPCKCHLCFKTFVAKCYLKKHLQTHDSATKKQGNLKYERHQWKVVLGKRS